MDTKRFACPPEKEKRIKHSLGQIPDFVAKMELPFNIGQSVYLRTDCEQHERLVTGFNIRANGIMVLVSYLTNESYHFPFEVSPERDVIKATSA